MDIGADLFLQMIKGMYPDYSEAFSGKYREWFQKADQNLFADWPGKTKGDNAAAFFKSWMERIQENFAKGEPFIDFEIQNKMMQSIIQNGNLYVKFMNAVLEATKATFKGEADDETLDEIYNKITQHYLEFYEKNVGKYLNIPQFGIQRETLHQIMATIDSYHGFMGAVGEFLVKFNMPLKNSLGVLQQAIKNREGADDSFKSAKEIYNFTVDILEKKYDEYLKSPVGVQNVVNVVEKYIDYKKESNRLKDMWFRSLSIPTRREMKDVYRAIYDLKKRARKQDAIIREQNEMIKTLNQKIQKLEGSLPGSGSKKKSATADTVQRKAKTKTSSRASQKAKASRG